MHAVISVGFLLLVGVQQFHLLVPPDQSLHPQSHDPCRENCGSFLGLFPKYKLCHDSTSQSYCTAFPRWHQRDPFVSCGDCQLVEESSTELSLNGDQDEKGILVDFHWEDACSDSPYDYVGTLVFCEQENGTFGYRSWNDALPCGSSSPLLRLRPGFAYQLRLINEASEPTNLHPHGLYVSGDGNADDITRYAGPGECLLFNWTLSEDHMDGTFLYHAHRHNITNHQVSGGAIGMLFVDTATPQTRPSWVDREKLLFIKSSKDEDFVNGMPKLHVPLIANTWYRFRIAVGDARGKLRSLRFDPEQCEVRLVAADGVWRSRGAAAPAFHYEVTGSTRMDLAVACQSSSGIWYRVNSTDDAEPIVVLDVSEGPAELNALEEWIPPRPSHLQSIANLDMDDTWNITISKETGINGYLYDHERPIETFEFGQYHQWRLYNTDRHPFHLHIYHMQIVTPGGCGNIFEEGEWYDTISADAAVTDHCTVRFRMNAFSGRTVLHCHQLSHEDLGVMVWTDVIGGPDNSFLQVGSRETVFCEICALLLL
jgi:FtsP/CotA-like multicopper oxidase with cupredoxin domain